MDGTVRLATIISMSPRLKELSDGNVSKDFNYKLERKSLMKTS